METQITKTEEPKLPEPVYEVGWGSLGAHQEDLLIPRINLAQALSQSVSNGKASPGDITESLNGEVLAKSGASIEIIPLMIFSEWVINKEKNGEWKFDSKVPYTPENAHWKFEELVDGQPIKRTKSINAFCLLPTRPDDLPFLIGFKSSSYFTGKKLSTHFQLSGMRRQPPAQQVFNLSSAKTSYEKYTYFVFDIAKSRMSTKEELASSYTWWKALNASKVKVEDEAVEAASSDESVPF